MGDIFIGNVKVSTLFGVMAVAVATIGPPLRVFSDRSPFTVSNIHFAVIGSDRLHVTATVKVSKGVDRPICHSQAIMNLCTAFG
jgi:hypothetical protein